MDKKVFLGGTCNGSQWREILKPKLTIDYYDPVVPHWSEEAYQRELREREDCDYCLYVITPKMTGFYSIAEVIDDSNKRPNKTVFCTLDKDDDLMFSKKQVNSLLAVGRMVHNNGGHWLINLDDVALFLNEGIEKVPDDQIIGS
ncbi:MAG: nucleoside 2-deoxyribosyltransferase domain-containing protein [Bacteroidales bacterium]|nr:nucleoside 2-deoxyribosyltransferase domain-containing protein [Bacteroidales bacterium]